MKILNKVISILVCFAFLSASISCTKFVEIDSPKNQIETSTLFNDDQAAISATVGLYSRMVSQSLWLSNGGVTLYSALSADELARTTSSVGIDEFTTNSLLPTNSILSGNLWNPSYRTIFNANSVLEGLNQPSNLTDSVKNLLEGEALVIRAFHFFYLVNLFGDVPLTLTTNYLVNNTMPRTLSSQVYQQIISDLRRAESLLKTSYPTANRVRINKWTATAFLSRVYLYNREWQMAEQLSTSIISSNSYSLVASNNLSNAFKINSSETIWQLMRETNNTIDGATYVPTNATTRPTYGIPSQLRNSFEPKDLRKINWTDSSKANNIVYYYPKKYKERTIVAGTSPTEFNVVFRLAEQYLIRAEARANQSNTVGAQDDLNVIRSRAGLSKSNSTDKSALLLEIEQERRKEFFVEWGHRWLDLKRLDRANVVLAPIKGANWQATDVLYPIPQSEIQLNPSLTQNPGY